MTAHVCSFCGVPFVWGKRSAWFGSWHEFETAGKVDWKWCGGCNDGKRPAVDQLAKARAALRAPGRPA